MLRTGSKSLRKKWPCDRNRTMKHPRRPAASPRLRVECLEDRTLLTSWGQIATAFNDGVVDVSGQAQTLADSAFAVSVPLVRTSFSQAVDVPGKLQLPFAVTVNPNETNLDKVRAELTQYGFNVERLDVTPDSNGNLILLSRDISFAASQTNFIVGGPGGDLGFAYFDDHVTGGLTIGQIQGTVQPATLHVAFGVDLVGTQPELFLQDSTRLNLPGVTGQTPLTGTMNIRNLLNVQIAGQAVLSLGASLTFVSPDGSHKLHLPDLTSANVIGSLNGQAKLVNVHFATQIPILPALQWTGNFTAGISTDPQGDKTITPTETTVTPDVWSTFENIVGALFQITPSLDFLKPIDSALNTRIPLLNFSLAWIPKEGKPANKMSRVNRYIQ
jgi:hypothetical protein